MKTRVRLLLGLLAVACHSPAQPANGSASTPKVAAAARARTEALDAIKQGNPNAALARLRAAVKHGAHAPADDVQVVGELCAIARELEAAQPGGGRAAALMAADEGPKAKPRLSRQDAATLDAQLGELHEIVLGNPTKARSFYQSALAQDATRQNARKGLARISRLEALIAAKARENAALRSRAK
jgi:hypothetical protein